MRILLIAHEFPPIPSPQALRWAYLVRELSRLGHDVHVLAPGHGGYGDPAGLPSLPAAVVVHRVYPGPFAGFQKWLTSVRSGWQGPAPKRASANASRGDAHLPLGLNWKGRFQDRVKALYGAVMFPDVRAEWWPWARWRLASLLRQLAPDIVIASHEPACTLSLGLHAKRAGFRFVADLGDPVLAAYTPLRWRRRASKLERSICCQADLVTVTTESTEALLVQRYGVAPEKLMVVTQGFDVPEPSRQGEDSAPAFSTGYLELLYTGSFYRFRDPQELLSAVQAVPGVRLSIASTAVPEELIALARRAPESIRLLGYLAHSEALRLQRQADVLVNLANDNSVQVPGKIYEYLGSGRPVLHLSSDDKDPVMRLLDATGGGWPCANRRDPIAAALSHLLRLKQGGGRAAFGLVRNDDAIAGYAWSSLANKLSSRLSAL